MNATTVDYRLTPEGAIFRRTTTEQELDVSNEIIERLAQNVVFKIPKVMDDFLELGTLGLTVTPQQQLWTVLLKRLPLKCPWHLADKTLVPVFNSKDDDVITVDWTPPPTMSLKLLIQSVPYQAYQSQWMFGAIWLFALNKKGETYKLPLANLHDDCLVCTGRNEIYIETLWDGLHKSVFNFIESRYNDHLFPNIERTHVLIRVKPEGKGFVTEPFEGNWEKLCAKISNNISSNLI